MPIGMGYGPQGARDDTPPLANALARTANSLETLETRSAALMSKLARAYPSVPRNPSPTSPTKAAAVVSAYVEAVAVINDRIEIVNEQLQYLLDTLEI